MGDIFGQILGGYLVDILGFPAASSIFGWGMVILAIFYYVEFKTYFF